MQISGGKLISLLKTEEFSIFSGTLTIDGGGFHSSGGPIQNNFVVRNGGDIRLPELLEFSDNNRLDVQVSFYELQSLASIEGLELSLATNSTIHTPELLTAAGLDSRAAIPDGAVWNAPKLTGLNDTTLNIEAGGVLNAPLLQTFRDSTVSIEPGVGFNTGLLTDIDDSQFSVAEGSVLTVGADGYHRTNQKKQITSFHVAGPGSLIDASSIQTITNANTWRQTYFYG